MFKELETNSDLWQEKITPYTKPSFTPHIGRQQISIDWNKKSFIV